MQDAVLGGDLEAEAVEVGVGRDGVFRDIWSGYHLSEFRKMCMYGLLVFRHSRGVRAEGLDTIGER